MKQQPIFRKTFIFFAFFLLAVCLTACEVAVTANGGGKIDFQAGVKDIQWKPLYTVTDNNMLFMGGFGKPIWDGGAPEDVKDYGFSLQTSWLSVRNATPEQDGMSLEHIWSAFNKKWVAPDGSINTVVMGYCVVDYNLSKLQVPGIQTAKHVHEYRIIVKSTPIAGGKFIDSLHMTIYTEGKWNHSDEEQLNIEIKDSDSGNEVSIQRL